MGTYYGGHFDTFHMFGKLKPFKKAEEATLGSTTREFSLEEQFSIAAVPGGSDGDTYPLEVTNEMDITNEEEAPTELPEDVSVDDSDEEEKEEAPRRKKTNQC
ncbi:hypothetical protein CYMTET_51444 [Cymbomonas tetramitiformis]|uniref:Uncharacterized protein n=1 Tax=Cymbomonas tetramitiformis TaxID=36881 RepID=A0AAE0BL66_9CHLO|nr:hypothetical protein CYMTET_51444 [Cymbomonas tetramitiformis]